MLRTGYFAVAGAALVAPPDIEYVRRWANSTNGTLYTSTSGSLGRAVDRLVVVVVNGTINGGGANSGVTGGTIGGVTATVHRGQVDTPTGTAYAQTDFLVARLPASNVSGTVSITYAGLHSSCVMNIYDIVGDANPFPTVYQGAGNAASKNVALASHKAAAAVGGGSSMAITVNSWTIASDGNPVIKDDEAPIRSNGSCAMHMLDASGTPTITFTPASAGSQLAAALAVFSVPPNAPADVLLVGGGGGGGGAGGNAGGGAAGGGGGGVIEVFNQPIWKDAPIPLTIGGGGLGGLGNSSVGNSGSNTSLGALTAIGGGGGASWNGVPRSGGSGGGASFSTLTGGAGTEGQGYAGGGGANNNEGGGGGGAGQAGANATSAPVASGKGGDGILSVLLNEYVGGGGGGGSYTGANGAGGLGGGTDGSYIYTGLPIDAAANTGGGGGGFSGGPSGGSTAYRGATGGSGVAVVRVPISRFIDVGAGLTYTITKDATHRTYKFTAGSGDIIVKDVTPGFVNSKLFGISSGATLYRKFEVPGMEVGDVGLASFLLNSTSDAVPAGWTHLQRIQLVNTSNWLSIYWKKLTQDDIDNPQDMSWGGTGRLMGSVFRDANSIAVLSSQGLAPGGQNPVIPAGTPSVDAVKVIPFVANNGSAASFTLPNNPEFVRKINQDCFGLFEGDPADYNNGTIQVNQTGGTTNSHGLYLLELKQ